MTSEGAAGSGTTLRDYLAVARRRKWVILQALVLVPAAALAFSLMQEKQFEASAEVLLSRQNLAAALTDTPDPAASLPADRYAETQADLARVPDVARRVIDDVGVEMTAEEFLDESSVSARQNADLLEFTVTDADAELATRLATAYAHEFAEYRRELDTGTLRSTRIELERRIAALRADGERDTELYRSLLDNQERLRTIEALQMSNAFPVRDAEVAEQVQPRPVRNTVLGVALGLVLGLGLAFLWEALDTRVRTSHDIATGLGLPFLGRIPAPPRKLQRHSRLAMLSAPTSAHAEPFRVLRTNLAFVQLDREVKTIMVTSAVEEEGKSTTVANLAVAVARAGRNVVLVDLDLRRPYLHRFFGLTGVSGRPDVPGITQVALGTAELDEALAPVALSGAEPLREGMRAWFRSRAENGHAPVERGSLRVLRAGPIPPDPGEFVATQRLAAILRELRARADVVLIDSPPLLRVGDAMSLSGRVDAMVVVTRLNVVRRQMLQELRRLLEAAPAAKLGFVVTGGRGDDAYGAYGYGYDYGYKPAKARKAVKEPT